MKLDRLKKFFTIDPLHILVTCITNIIVAIIYYLRFPLYLPEVNILNVFLFVCSFLIILLVIACLECIKSNKAKCLLYAIFFSILVFLMLPDESELSFFEVNCGLFMMMLLFSPVLQLIYQIIAYKKSTKKFFTAETFDKIGKNILQLIIVLAAEFAVMLLAGLLVAFIEWAMRDKALFEALSINSEYFEFNGYLNQGFAIASLFSYFATIILIKKAWLQKLNRIFISVLIATIMVNFIAYVVYVFGEDVDFFDPLSYTITSESFNPYNVPMLKEGMSKEEIINLVGEPMSEIPQKMTFTKYENQDGYAYHLSVFFDEDGKASKISSYWFWL